SACVQYSEHQSHLPLAPPAMGLAAHALVVRDLAGEKRATLLELAQHVAAERRVLLQVGDQPAVERPVPAAHARLEEGQVLGRPDERVPFDELPLLPEQAVELRRVERPEPGPEDEMLRRRNDGDWVELQEPQPADRVEDVGRRAVEELRADRDSPGLLDRRLAHRATRSSSSVLARRDRVRSRASPRRFDCWTPGSTWKARTCRTPSVRSALRSARPT